MRNIEGLEQEIISLVEFLENSIIGFSDAASKTQDKITEVIRKILLSFELKERRFIRDQDFRKHLSRIDTNIKQILGSGIFSTPIREYLTTFTTVEQRNIAVHKTYNDLDVEVKALSPVKKMFYGQAEHYLLGAGLAESYIQPAKYLVMQMVTTGITLKDGMELLDKWDKGELTDGKITNGRQTPDLQRYATQIARDTTYQYNGTINEIIKEEYRLESFIYTGDLVRDSRPLCKHLIGMNREIKFSELPALLKRFPQGVIPGTDKNNFSVYRGGYNCRHFAFPVRTIM